MSELELLFLILAVIYTWECACWLPRGSVAFLSWTRRRWQLVHPGVLLGNQRGGFIFAYPVPPLGTLLTGSQFPLSISPDAVLAYVAPSVNPGGRPVQTGRLLRFDDLRAVEAKGRKVLVNGKLLVKAASPIAAAELAGRLRQLAKTDAGARKPMIEDMIQQRFDTKEIDRRWREFQSQSTRVRLLTNLLFGYLFVLAPLAIWHFGLLLSWPVLVIGLLGFTIATSISFRRCHKAFYPAAEDERFTHFLTILLSPATTIRACDVLSRPLLESFHPLAVAKVFCPDNNFREFANQALRDIRHPALPVFPSQDPAGQAIDRYARALLQKTAEEFLKKAGINPDKLVQPPARADETCQSYCPRCLAQFTTSQGVCDDCGGLALVEFLADESVSTHNDKSRVA